MAITFPASPNTNDTHIEGSITYKWDGDKWIGIGVSPADRLVESSNKLEIESNNLLWTGGDIGIGTLNPASEIHLESTAPVMKVDATNNASGFRLDILGQTGGSNGQLFRVQRDGTTKLQLNDDGDLVITGDDNAELKLKAGNETSDDVIAFLNSSGTTKGNIFYDTDDNFMAFKTNGTASGNERLRIDLSGCLRVGNTANETTSSTTKRIALGAKASIWGWTSGNIDGALTLADNYYWDGSNNKIIESDYAAYLSLREGTLRFGSTDAAGTAGDNAPGIHESFRVGTGGDLWARKNSAVYLVLGSSGDATGDGTTPNNNMNWIRSNANNLQLNCADTGFLGFETNGAERFVIESDGELQVKKLDGSDTGGSAPASGYNGNGTAVLDLVGSEIGGTVVSSVADNAVSAAIRAPRRGCFAVITPYSNPSSTADAYPQPNTACMVYLDLGPSRNIQICELGNVGTAVVAKTTYDATATNSDNNKLTVMAGSEEYYFHLVNREGNSEYRYKITFL